MLNACLGISDEEFAAKQAEIEAEKPPKKAVVHRVKVPVGLTLGLDFKEIDAPEWKDKDGNIIFATDNDLLHFAFGSVMSCAFLSFVLFLSNVLSHAGVV